MSRFFTPIPVDLDSVCKALPEGSFLERVRWNPETSCVEVQWDHNQFLTGKDFPVEFGDKDLQAHRLPKGTVAREKRRADSDGALQTLREAGVRTLKGKTLPVRKRLALKVRG